MLVNTGLKRNCSIVEKGFQSFPRLKIYWPKSAAIVVKGFKFSFLFLVFWVSLALQNLTLYHTILSFDKPGRLDFKNILGKGENAGNQCFLLFPQCFIHFLNESFEQQLLFRLQMLSVLPDLSKNLPLYKMIRIKPMLLSAHVIFFEDSTCLI